MNNNVLLEIERIDLVKTEYGENHKTIEFRFTNFSTYCMFDDEEVECEIDKETAIKLIEILKREFEIGGVKS